MRSESEELQPPVGGRSPGTDRDKTAAGSGATAAGSGATAAGSGATAAEAISWAREAIDQIGTVFLGKREVAEKTVAAILARGHVLLEDVPGTGKTVLARALGASLGGVFRRLQCTPDLLPADAIGVSIFDPDKRAFRFKRGPVFCNVLLVDEINRATPRTQSALLEAMAESQVSVEGRSRALPRPFLVIATENPIDFEGTFPLPEAQRDRFLLTLAVGYPDAATEAAILEGNHGAQAPVEGLRPLAHPQDIARYQDACAEIFVAAPVRDYIVALSAATRADARLRLGASPRGSLALYRASQGLALCRGRDYVSPLDVQEMLAPVYRSRVILSPEASLRGATPDIVLAEIGERVPAPSYGGSAPSGAHAD
jgi:MoxR-like ATPase